MTEPKYYIRVKYDYYAGTIGAVDNGQCFDLSRDAIFDSKEAAQKVIDEAESGEYHLRHGECGRPEYKILKIRNNQVIGKHVFHYRHEKEMAQYNN